MKKEIYIVGMIALIAAMMVMPAAAAFEPGECDIYVHDGDSIKDKVSSASEGQTICVWNGTYSPYFVINKKNIRVAGEDADVVTLHCDGVHGIEIGTTQNASGAVVEGFTVVNSPSGVTVAYSAPAPNCIIRNCVFDGLSADYGIGIKADNTTFENNIVRNATGTTAVIYAPVNSYITMVNNTFRDNKITDTTYGRVIDVEKGNWKIVNNTIVNNTRPGILLLFADATNNIIRRNAISSNGKCGIWLYNAGEGNKIYLNNFVDNDATVVIDGTPPTTTYWNSTEPIEYVCPTDGNTYTDYLGNYWSDHPGGAEDGCGIWATPYGIPGSSDNDYRPLMAGYENYLGEPAGEEKPDLNVTAITTPANIFANESNGINATIANTGSGDAGAFNVSLRADGDVVDRTGVTGLDAGNSTEVSLEWTPAASGTYELCVVADCDGVIDESDETNNVTCRSVYATQPGNEVYFVPEDSGASYCNSVDIELMADVNEANPVTATSVNFTFDPNCVNITNWAGNTSVWAGGTTSTILWSIPQGFIKITTAIGANPAATGTVPLGTLTLHCNCTEYCKTGLDFTTAEYTKEGGGTIYAEVQNGTFTCETAAVPDLIVESITANCGYLFANESNEICAKITNNGAATGASNTSFVINGYSGVVEVPALAAGANTTVCVTDPTIRTLDDVVTITVTADCNGEVSESDETNNVTIQSEMVVNNGYKGKRYTGGEDLATIQTHTLNGNLLYSLGDSYYLSSSTYPDWTTYNVSWNTSDLPVPGTATIEKARLYAMYTWDKKGVMSDNVSMTFNGVTQTLDKHYSDEKMYATSYPYGMLTYNVTDDFNTGGNVANLTNSYSGGNNVSIRGMLLVVIYADESEPERTIFVNEEFDLLYGGSSQCTTAEEATAYAPFAGPAIDLAKVENATLITIAPGAGPNEGELIFNGHTWTDVWNFVGTGSPAPQIGIDKRDVKLYLNDSGNEAGFQSSADYMEASNAFLVVTHKEELPPSEYTIIIGDYTLTLALYDGGEVIVPVKILNASDIAGGSAKILFNASVVKVKAVSAGHFDTPAANIDNTAGFVHVAAARAFAAGREEAVLANVLFEGISEGYTALNVQDALLNFVGTNTTTPTTIDGSITVETWMLGDLNHNDMIDTGDATLVLRMVVGLEPANMLGDMNHNGMIDTGDATLILRTVVGLPVP